MIHRRNCLTGVVAEMHGKWFLVISIEIVTFVILFYRFSSNFQFMSFQIVSIADATFMFKDTLALPFAFDIKVLNPSTSMCRDI